MTIIVGYVPTAEGDAALERATWEAGRDGKKLIVINASRSDTLEGDTSIANQERLAQIHRQLENAELEFEIHQPLRGADPADEIVQAAAENHASLIVIGLRHRSRVGKIMFGSTAQTVLLDADCPVLAVKAS